MPGLDLSTIIAEALNFNQASASAAVGLQKNASKQEGLANETADAIKVSGDNAALIDSVAKSAELETQQVKIRLANELGTNGKDQSERISALSKTITEQYNIKADALARIQEKKSVGFFEDPLQYIMNSLTVNDDIDVHNAANERMAAAENQLATINQLTQATNKTQTELTESLNASAVKASADNIKINADNKSREAQIIGLTYNSEGIKAALNADKDRLTTAFSVFGAQKQQQQMEIALAHLAMQREEFDWKKEQKSKEKAGDDYIIQKINDGMKLRMGEAAQLIEPGSVKAAQVVSLLKSNSPAGKIYSEDYLIGEQSAVAGTRILAPSPAKAIDLLQTVPVKLTAAQTPVKAILDTALSDVQKAIANGTLDSKNKQAVEKALNDRAQGLMNEYAKNIKPGDSDNPYNIPNLRQLITSSPTVAKLPIVEKVLGPAISAGADLDANKAFGLVATALAKKEISYKEALDISTIYSVGTSATIEARQFTALGLVPKFSYNTKITTNPFSAFGGNEIVDLTKPDVVGRSLNKYLASRATQEAFDSMNPFILGENLPKEFGSKLTPDPRQGKTNIYGR